MSDQTVQLAVLAFNPCLDGVEEREYESAYADLLHWFTPEEWDLDDAMNYLASLGYSTECCLDVALDFEPTWHSQV
jgi:hypothetical protein